MTSTISTKSHSFCCFHLVSKLNLSCKISLSNYSGNRCATNAPNHCNACCLEYSINDIIDAVRSEEHTSELQSLRHLVCRLLLEKTKIHGGTPFSLAIFMPPSTRNIGVLSLAVLILPKYAAWPR